MDYKVGDKVSYLGWVGTVIKIESDTDYPLRVDFKDNGQSFEEKFTLDGRLNRKHLQKAIKFVSRPQIKKVHKLYKALYYSKDKDTFYIEPRLFHSEEEAKTHRPDGFVKLITTRPIVIEDL